MVTRKRLEASVRLPALFVLLTGVPLVALGWLGWRVLQQDRALETQRSRERLESAATMVTRELDRGLRVWEDVLAAAAQRPDVEPPANTTFLLIDSSDSSGVVQQRGTRLPYYPAVRAPSDAASLPFAAAEAQEFRDNDLRNAAASYRVLARSSNREVRAGALMRLARCLRKQQQLRSALDVYAELAMMGDTGVAGSPSELVARRERTALLRTMGEPEAAGHESALLAAALSEGRFLIDRSTFDFFRESVPASAARTEEKSTRPIHLAEAVAGLWSVWRDQPSGRATWAHDTAATAAVWRRTGTGTAVLVGDVEMLTTSTIGLSENLQVRLGLEDASGRSVWGAVPADDSGVTKVSRETGLPWTVHVAPADPAAAGAISTSRRNLFAAGFGLIVLIIASASYFVFRAVNRELGVARLQSDFVDTVSHEFRTPLTAMCHLTEMLEEGAAPPDRLPHYYRALGKESRRLTAMVENLLDFGRMEAGRRTYEFVDTDAAAFVNEIVHEFREHAPLTAHRLEVLESPDRFRIRADRSALALALRNLVDNALKYSPDTSLVKVSVRSQGSFVGISVEDEGPGISKDEQRDVFRKFARGSAARTLNVKGTGIGLTMADQIVRAHGGHLELASEPGRGSRFTTLLPAHPGPA